MDVDPFALQRLDDPLHLLELVDDSESDEGSHPPPKVEVKHCKADSEDQTCRCKRVPDRPAHQYRKLIVCIDGTSNHFDRKNNTNIIRLYSRIKKSDTQLTYYNSGIGTYAKPSHRSWKHLKQFLVSKIDLAIAWDLEKVILAAYRWLSENYRDGDRIYLFGFSRGAYQVRVLAGMIETVGLLYAGNEEQIPFAYVVYVDSKNNDGQMSRRNMRKEEMARYSAFSRVKNMFRSQRNKTTPSGEPAQNDSFTSVFKNAFSREDVQVHFLGAWDTVSSVGFFRGRPLPVTDTCDHVCFFRHALALDERRVKFLPEHVQSRAGERSRCKEVWFPGSHSQIGGVGDYSELKIAQVPLLWMENEAQRAHLEMHPFDVKRDGWEELPEKSLRWGWWLLEFIPCLGFSYSVKGKRRTDISPNFGRGRTLQLENNQFVHASAAFKPRNHAKYYKPKAVLANTGLTWGDLLGTVTTDGVRIPEKWQGYIEMDLFDDDFPPVAFTVLQDSSDEDLLISYLNRLIILAWSASGRRAILKVDRSLAIILGLFQKSMVVVSKCSMRLLLSLSTPSGHSVAKEEPSVEDLLSKTANEHVLGELLQPRLGQPQEQLAALQVVTLLLEQVSSREMLLEIGLEEHLVKLLRKWIHERAAGDINISTATGDIIISTARALVALTAEVIASTGDVKDVKVIVGLENKRRRTQSNQIAISTSLNILSSSFLHRFTRLREVADLNESIFASENAVRFIPDDHPEQPALLSHLGRLLLLRFKHLGEITDIDRSVLVFQAALKHTPEGHPKRPAHLNNLGSSLLYRFKQLGGDSDVHWSIRALKCAMKLTPLGDPDALARAINLGYSLLYRFEKYGDITDIRTSITTFKQAMQQIPNADLRKPSRLSNFEFGRRLLKYVKTFGRGAELEPLIRTLEIALPLIPTSHPDGSDHASSVVRVLRPRSATDVSSSGFTSLNPDWDLENASRLSDHADSLLLRYRHNGNLADLDESIFSLETAVAHTPVHHPDHPVRSSSLGRSLRCRFDHHNKPSDLNAAIHHFSYAARSSVGLPLVRFRAALQWANCSLMKGAPTLDAYQRALDLLPRVAWFGLPIADRHKDIAGVEEVTRDAMAAAIEAGKYQTALEWLEQTNSFDWGQRYLRVPFDFLRVHEPALAEGLENVTGYLERESNRDVHDSRLSMEGIGTTYCQLALEWDELMEHARTVAGFHDLLEPRTLSGLRDAARAGPVVVVSVHKRRCDALILTADSESDDAVQHVPLHGFSYNQAQELQRSLDESLTQASAHIDEALTKVLSELWVNIVEPVLERLALPISRNDDPPRIWWCPTGPLVCLPLHAAGIYDEEKLGFKISDFVVSSYTPSLAALVDTSRQPQAAEFQLLAVARPTTPNQLPTPNTTQELVHIQKHVGHLRALTLEGDQANVKNVIQGMAECNWIHLACHFTQHPNDPDKSALLLHDGRLGLSEIVQTPLPQAEFAFLSAYEVSTDAKRFSGGVIHVGKRLVIAGYCGVITTAWAIKASDTPPVVDEVYARLFKDGRPDHTRAAHALHHAVKRLRETEGVTFSSWVPFIHIGM